MSEEKKPVSKRGIIVDGNSVLIGFTIHYSNGDPIPCAVLSDSVKGVNCLLRECDQALFKLLRIDSNEKPAILIDTLTQGSKFFDFYFRCLFGSDEEAAATADTLHKRMGVNKMLESRHVQNVVIAAIIAYGLYNTAKLFMPKETAGTVIDATHSIILNVGHDLGLSGDQVFEALKDGVENKRKAAKASVQALLPAKMKSNTEVRIGGKDGFLLPQAVLQNLPDPEEIDTSEPSKTMDIDGIEITVIASDIQKTTSGWAVILPSGYPFSGKRIKAELGENITPADMMYKKTITVDLTVYRDPSKNMKPTHVLIRSINSR